MAALGEVHPLAPDSRGAWSQPQLSHAEPDVASKFFRYLQHFWAFCVQKPLCLRNLHKILQLSCQSCNVQVCWASSRVHSMSQSAIRVVGCELHWVFALIADISHSLETRIRMWSCGFCDIQRIFDFYSSLSSNCMHRISAVIGDFLLALFQL